MDHMKEALKKKMGKAVEIHIHVGKDPKEEEKTTDLAPTVMDSQEPGVMTGAHGQMPQVPEMEMPQNDQYANALLSNSPAQHPAAGKTLDSVAHEKLLSRMHAKKGLKG